MTINPEHLLNRSFPVQRIELTPESCILYALGIGLGTGARALPHVYEGASGGQRACPTMAAVIGFPGFWAREPDTGIDWRKLVHGEQVIEFFAPLPVGGTIEARNRISALYDKGEGRGAVLIQERHLTDCATGKPLARLEQLTLLRGDGGFSDGDPAYAGRPPAPHALPGRAPDAVAHHPSLPQAALIYRLSGDMNPLHADPEVAAQAGFEKPILHGMATLAMAFESALAERLADADDIARLRLRFSAPFYPGETLRTEFWKDATGLSFRSFAQERDVRVLDNGRIHLRPDDTKE